MTQDNYIQFTGVESNLYSQDSNTSDTSQHDQDPINNENGITNHTPELNENTTQNINQTLEQQLNDNTDRLLPTLSDEEQDNLVRIILDDVKGDTLDEKQENHLRIMFQNINSLRPNTTDKWEATIRQIFEFKADIVGLCETCTNWKNRTLSFGDSNKDQVLDPLTQLYVSDYIAQVKSGTGTPLFKHVYPPFNGIREVLVRNGDKSEAKEYIKVIKGDMAKLMNEYAIDLVFESPDEAREERTKIAWQPYSRAAELLAECKQHNILINPAKRYKKNQPEVENNSIKKATQTLRIPQKINKK
jgi:hypothetical protein